METSCFLADGFDLDFRLSNMMSTSLSVITCKATTDEENTYYLMQEGTLSIKAMHINILNDLHEKWCSTIVLMTIILEYKLAVK